MPSVLLTLAILFPTSEVSPQAAGYLVKYVADSIITDGASSSGPHGISLSTTMDDDVFVDGTLREEAKDKTPDSQEEELSDRSVVKVSPGAVRQEVSQAISDKKGTLIIFKQAEDKEDTQDEGMSKKEGLAVSAESKTDRNEKQTEASAAVKGQASLVNMQSAKFEIKTGDAIQIQGVGSPKKAMASWISEEKAELSEVVGVLTKEELKAVDKLQQKAEEIQFNQPKSSLTHITVSESSAASLAVVLYENKQPPSLIHASPTHSSPPSPPPQPTAPASV